MGKITEANNVTQQVTPQPNPEKRDFYNQVLQKMHELKPQTILDVGGAEQPLIVATHIIDKEPYESFEEYQRLGFIPMSKEKYVYTKDTWCQRDFYDLPWPYADKQFDFVWCTQTLEDIRDPIAVCKEMMRVGKAGYIETPGVLAEICNDFWHHRWFVKVQNSKIMFLQKSSLFKNMVWNHHSPMLIYPMGRKQKYQDRACYMLWRDKFEVQEIICKTAKEHEATLMEWLHDELEK